MPRTCTVCVHPERPEIDRALLNGESFRDIARRFRVSKDSLSRHRRDHLSTRVAKAAQRNADADVKVAIDVVTQLRIINDEAHAVLADARESRDGELRLKSIEQLRKQIELQARLIDLIQDGTTVNVIISPQWLSVRAVILSALSRHPEAAVAVSDALTSIEGPAT